MICHVLAAHQTWQNVPERCIEVQVLGSVGRRRIGGIAKSDIVYECPCARSPAERRYATRGRKSAHVSLLLLVSRKFERSATAMAALLPFVTMAAIYGYLSSNKEVQYQRATVDSNDYLVIRKDDAPMAANLLAVLRRDLESLVAYLKKNFPDDKDVLRLVQKFNPHAISEGAPGSGYTSYTVDKGAKIVLCIRQSDGSFVPRNVIMYVAIHELAHIMTSSVGHTPEFWANNARVLEAAKSAGLYSPQDWDTAPQPYCGIHIGPHT